MQEAVSKWYLIAILRQPLLIFCTFSYSLVLCKNFYFSFVILCILTQALCNEAATFIAWINKGFI